jgi:hypothetical protein
MLLHRLYPTLIIIHLDVSPLSPTASIHSYNDYGSIPFMAGFWTPDSLIAHCMPFVPSRCYRTSPDQPRLCADMLTHPTLYVPHLWDVLWTFAYCVHVLLFVHAVTTEACEYCFQYNDLVPSHHPLPRCFSNFLLDRNECLKYHKKGTPNY